MVWRETLRKDSRLKIEVQKIETGGRGTGMKLHKKYIVYDREFGEHWTFYSRKEALKFYRELKASKSKKKHKSGKKKRKRR